MSKLKPTCPRKTKNTWSPWSQFGGWKCRRTMEERIWWDAIGFRTEWMVMRWRSTHVEKDTASAASPGIELFEVCLLVPRAGVALVPWPLPFLSFCTDAVTRMGNRCPLCHTQLIRLNHCQNCYFFAFFWRIRRVLWLYRPTRPHYVINYLYCNNFIVQFRYLSLWYCRDITLSNAT